MRRSPKRRRRAGFTLVEVLLVLVILVVIASLGIANYSRAQRKAYMNAAKAQVGQLSSLAKQYQIDVGDFPPSLEALLQPPPDLANPAKWNGPYLEKATLPLDPWDRPYEYQYPGIHNPELPDIYSAGPDGVKGTQDDVGNWD
jgi:general secretion pathway protein G